MGARPIAGSVTFTGATGGVTNNTTGLVLSVVREGAGVYLHTLARPLDQTERHVDVSLEHAGVRGGFSIENISDTQFRVRCAGSGLALFDDGGFAESGSFDGGTTVLFSRPLALGVEIGMTVRIYGVGGGDRAIASIAPDRLSVTVAPSFGGNFSGNLWDIFSGGAGAEDPTRVKVTVWVTRF